MSDDVVAHQLRYDLLVAWRNPQSRFFAIVLPVIFLVLLASVFGNHTTHVNGNAIKNSTFMSRNLDARGRRRIVREPRDPHDRAAGERRAEAATLDTRSCVGADCGGLTAVILSIVVVVVLVVIGRIVRLGAPSGRDAPSIRARSRRRCRVFLLFVICCGELHSL